MNLALFLTLYPDPTIQNNLDLDVVDPYGDFDSNDYEDDAYG